MANTLTSTESQVLQAIYKYNQKHGYNPEPGRIAIEKGLGRTAKSNHLKALTKKGYLEKVDGRYRLTAMARTHLSSDGLIGRVEIPILGHVYAGPGPVDIEEPDLWVHLDDANTPSVPLVDQSLGSQIIGLRVQGQSMVHEGIMADDLVIVQTFADGEQPKDGQLIITNYVDLRDASFNEVKEDYAEPEVHGPVLKYVYRKENYWRLGWKTEHRTSPYTLQAARIVPFGKVVGLYRRFS